MCIRSQLSLRIKIKLQAVESHLTSLLGICSSETHCLIRYLNISFRNGNKDHASLWNTGVTREGKQPYIFNLTVSTSLSIWETWVCLLSVRTLTHLLPICQVANCSSKLYVCVITDVDVMRGCISLPPIPMNSHWIVSGSCGCT